MEKGSGGKRDRESSNPEHLIQRDSFFLQKKGLLLSQDNKNVLDYP